MTNRTNRLGVAIECQEAGHSSYIRASDLLRLKSRKFITCRRIIEGEKTCGRRVAVEDLQRALMQGKEVVYTEIM